MKADQNRYMDFDVIISPDTLDQREVVWIEKRDAECSSSSIYSSSFVGSVGFFKNQTGGTACNHKCITGCPSTIGYSTNDVFNPNWWYNNTYRSKYGHKGFINGFNWGSHKQESQLKEIEATEQLIINDASFTTWTEFIPKFELILNEINKEFQFIVVEMEEAWAVVKRKVGDTLIDGVVAWQNCD